MVTVVNAANMVTMERIDNMEHMDFVARVNDVLGRIRRQNPSLNIILYLNPDAVSEAKVIQDKIVSGTAGRLAGKIIGVKSCICVEGMPTTCASKTLEGWYAPYDADVIAAIRKEDGLIIGMLNMDEFACGASGETSAFGPAQNPAAPGYITGGSSSGSAAAVAAGFCDMALGTDTGGSIRNPASHCGVVGIKPSYGRVSRYGLIDLSMSLDQIGPLAATVEDAALLLEVISDKTPHDPTMRDDPLRPFQLNSVGPLRIGMSEAIASLCVDDRIMEMIRRWTASFIASYGGSEVAVSLQHIDLAVQTYYPLVYVEFYSGTRKLDGRKYARKIEETCGVEVLRRILGGKIISHSEFEGKYYKKALAAKQLIARELADCFTRCDVLIMPTTPTLPHKLGAEVSIETMYGYDAFTIPANLAGICAGVVPVGVIDGVPVGLQVCAPAGREDVLLQVLRGMERLR